MIDILGTLLVPSGWIATLSVLALALLPLQRFRQQGFRALATSALLYFTFALGPVAHLLLGPLERTYAPLTELASLRNVDTIVLLTGYASRNTELPPTDQLNASSAFRLLQALWLMTGKSEADIIISGNGESARVLGEAAIALALPAKRVLVHDGAMDTGRSAEQLKVKLESGRCVLVTSAGHMPRAMGIFRRQGINCLPAPTEFYTPYALGFFDYLPHPRNLELSDHAVHEYLALIWYHLNGRL